MLPESYPSCTFHRISLLLDSLSKIFLQWPLMAEVKVKMCKTLQWTMVTKAQNLAMANFSQINQKNYKPNVLHIKHYNPFNYILHLHVPCKYLLGGWITAFGQILTLNDQPPFGHFFFCNLTLFLSSAKQGDNALGSVRPLPLSRLNYLTYDLDIWYVGRRSKVEVKCQKSCFYITVTLL